MRKKKQIVFIILSYPHYSSKRHITNPSYIHRILEINKAKTLILKEFLSWFPKSQVLSYTINTWNMFEWKQQNSH